MAAAHPITNTLECFFDDDKVVTIGGYSCILHDININVTQQTQKILIAGVHSGDHSNTDVINVKFLNSHTPFIITEVLEAFPNVEGLEIRKSSLQRIQSFALSTAPKLKNIIIVENKIPTLEHGAFNGLEKLEVLLLVSNHIETIANGAFFGLENLKILWLTHNRFKTLEPTVFGSLINLKKLIVTHSFWSRVDNEIFNNNTNLEQLVLTDNKFTEIDPSFIDTLKNLEMLKLKDNICVNQDFIDLEKKVHKEDLADGLKECFDNFMLGLTERKELETVDEPKEMHRITLEIEGRFTIRNEKGDILYST